MKTRTSVSRAIARSPIVPTAGVESNVRYRNSATTNATAGMVTAATVRAAVPTGFSATGIAVDVLTSKKFEIGARASPLEQREVAVDVGCLEDEVETEAQEPEEVEEEEPERRREEDPHRPRSDLRVPTGVLEPEERPRNAPEEEERDADLGPERPVDEGGPDDEAPHPATEPADPHQGDDRDDGRAGFVPGSVRPIPEPAETDGDGDPDAVEPFGERDRHRVRVLVVASRY